MIAAKTITLAIPSMMLTKGPPHGGISSWHSEIAASGRDGCLPGASTSASALV